MPVTGPGNVLACPELGLTMSDDSSTAWNVLAGTFFSSLTSDGGHAFVAAPPKYQLLPLSARISPYCCMARSTTCAWAENPLRLNVDFRRNRAPIGGRSGS